ncbi:riboflavin kinase [Boletus reticuloceps]|uniref:Riboflavin kinase n=1 Tax=Boletus reticuloceps TaxID=495285 RepID=A0A8I2YUM4_9AGAM|nr:riboflavin kinase [Boletus reticuloceps]
MGQLTSSDASSPPPVLETDSFRSSRPNIVGPDTPEDSYPIRLEGTVQHGFGRGSKELGCPTVHPIPSQPPRRIHRTHGQHRQARCILWICSSVLCERSTIGVASRRPGRVTHGNESGVESVLQEPTDDRSMHRVPSQKNPLNPRIQEIHIMHNFHADFYGYELKTLVLGYIRPELDYISRGKCMIPANSVQVLIRVNRGAHRRHRDGQEGGH